MTAAQLRVQKGESPAHEANASCSVLTRPFPSRTLRFTCYQANAQPSPADLSELSLGSTMKTEFPDPDDILNFILTITPDEGLYRGGKFTFTFAINQNFPHEPPKVRCREKIYHPNIDLEGKVCLNILREDWKPVLNLNAVIVGLQVRRRLLLERLFPAADARVRTGLWGVWGC